MQSHSSSTPSTPFHQEMGNKICAYGYLLQILDDFENAKIMTVIDNATGQSNQDISLNHLKKPYKISELVLAILSNANKTTNIDVEELATHIILDEKHSFKLNIKNDLSADCHHVHIEKMLAHQTTINTSNAITANSPATCHLKIGKSHSTVMLDGKELMRENGTRPRGLQSDIILMFGQSLQNGNLARLLLMATGSGKSFVIAGILLAIGNGVSVVPNQILAKELEDAIKSLCGHQAVISRSTDTTSIASFAEAFEKFQHMIMIADDPLFSEKAALITNKVVMIDEVQQHTYSDASIATLEKIKLMNILLSLTGTPTSPLYKIFTNEPLADINLRKVMDMGVVRQMNAKADVDTEENLAQLLLQNYFGRTVFTHSGIGYMNPSDIKNALMEMGMNEEEAEKNAIEKAIEHNREDTINEKNFIFIDDTKMREQIRKTYQDVANNTYTDLPGLTVHIRNSLHEYELNERADMIKHFHPERDIDKIKTEIENKVGFHGPIVLAKKIKQAQQNQINNTINAYALNILFPDKSTRDIELMLRVGQLPAFVMEKNNTKDLKSYLDVITEENINEFLHIRFFPSLPKEQREPLITEVTKTALEIREKIKKGVIDWDKHLHKASDVNLDLLMAQYIVIAPANEQPNESKDSADKEAAKILDQLRSGLVIHVISDERFSTGISIPSVRSCQHLIYSNHDKLNDPVLIIQLVGRTVRDKDGIAVVYQLTNKSKVDNLDTVLTPDDIIDANSGVKVKNTYDKIESSTKSLLRRSTEFQQQVLFFGHEKKPAKKTSGLLPMPQPIPRKKN